MDGWSPATFVTRNDQRTTGDQRPARLARLILARYGEASP
jgi:hypothetical protein